MLSATSPLITPAQLADCLAADPLALRVCDCRFQLSDPDWGYQQYLQGHLPGAIYAHLDRDLSSPVGRHGGRHPLPDPQTLAQTLERWGIIQGETWVVAYDDSRFAFASRLWWLLRYLGHDRVVVLDGGWPAWQRWGGSVTTEIPDLAPGRFVPQVRQDWVVEIDAIRTRPASTLLIDSRERDRYEGLREPIDPRAGHIPGAICLPWQEVTARDGQALSAASLQARWQPYQTQPEQIVYCGSGVTACVNLLSQAIAGLDLARLYPGGWSDWCSYDTNDR